LAYFLGFSCGRYHGRFSVAALLPAVRFPSARETHDAERRVALWRLRDPSESTKQELAD